MTCPFKYCPEEIYYKDANGVTYEGNQIWTKINDRAFGDTQYVNNKDETVIKQTKENKNISMCDWRKKECVGESKCPIVRDRQQNISNNCTCDRCLGIERDDEDE